MKKTATNTGLEGLLKQLDKQQTTLEKGEKAELLKRGYLEQLDSLLRQGKISPEGIPHGCKRELLKEYKSPETAFKLELYALAADRYTSIYGLAIGAFENNKIHAFMKKCAEGAAAKKKYEEAIHIMLGWGMEERAAEVATQAGWTPKQFQDYKDGHFRISSSKFYVDLGIF